MAPIPQPNPPLYVSTLDEILRFRAQEQPDRLAYIFLEDGETESGRLTYAELDRKARVIAAELYPSTAPLRGSAQGGERPSTSASLRSAFAQDARREEARRALLLYPPGL